MYVATGRQAVQTSWMAPHKRTSNMVVLLKSVSRLRGTPKMDSFSLPGAYFKSTQSRSHLKHTQKKNVVCSYSRRSTVGET